MLKTHSKTQRKSADLVSNKLRIGVFQRYQMKCKSVSKKSPRYKELDELIAELRNHHNTTILLIEHDMKLVMGISDRIYVVNQGTPLANGTPEQIRNNPDVIRAYLGEA